MQCCMRAKDKEVFMRALENYDSILEDMIEKGQGGPLSIIPFDPATEKKRAMQLHDAVNNLPEC